MHVFLHTNLPPARAAERLAAELGAQLTQDDEGRVFVSRPVRDGGAEGEAGGQVHSNFYGAPPDPKPDEVSVIDGYDTAFEIRCAIENEEVSRVEVEEIRQVEAERFFTDITERLGWPALLVTNLDILVAAWSPAHGRTDFPTGTTPDPPHWSLWRWYAITTTAEGKSNESAR